MPGHCYTAEELAYLRRHGSVERQYLTKSFNNHFGTAISVRAINQKCRKLGVKSSVNGRFEPGHVPYNAGTKGLKVGSSTSFKAGQMPHNWVPVGTEVVESKDGYTKVKIAEPKTWKHKHVLLWEQRNGPLPKGKVVIFADRNNQNFAPDNLIAVERRELLYLNIKALIKPDQELTKAAVNIAKLAVRTAELRRKNR